MKILLIFLASLLLFNLPLQSNPIPPAGLIVEIYFEDGEWVLIADNYYLDMMGYNNFEDMQLSNGNVFVQFQPDFYPDSTNWLTAITNDALVAPLELYPDDGFVGIYSDYYDEINTLKWGPDPYDPVAGLQPNQSSYIHFVTSYEYYDYIFWQVKSTGCNNYPYGGDCTGTFLGFVYDQNGNPVGDAELYYTEDYILDTGYDIHHIITDNSGYYFFDGMLARNYHIHKIVADDVDYPTNEYFSLEPNDTVNLDFTIYTTQTPEWELQETTTLSNFPNPFKKATTFIINLPEINNPFIVLEICDITGKIVASFEADSKTKSQSLYWNVGSMLPPGQYLVLLKSNQQILATHKIIAE